MRFDIVNIVAVFELGLFSVFLLVRNFRSWPNRFLALFLMAQAADCANAVIDHQSVFFIVKNAHLFYIGYPAHYLIPPAIYLYFVSVKEVPLRRIFLKALHFIPSFVILVYLVFCFFIQPVDVKRELIQTGGVFNLQALKFFFGGVFLQTFTYVFFTHRLIQKNKDGNQVHKQHSRRVNWRWLIIFFYGYALLCLVALIPYVMGIMGHPFPAEPTLLIIYGLFFRVLYADFV